MDEPEFLDPDSFIDEPKFSMNAAPMLLLLTIIVMIPIYAVYIIYSMNQDGANPEAGVFDYIRTMSLGIFLLSQAGQIFICFYSKWQLDWFLKRYPVIENQEMLESLKPLIRTNMYFVPLVLLFAGLSIPTGLICLWQNGLIQAGIVVVSWSITTVVGIVCSATEKKIRSLDCANPDLDTALKRLSHSWEKRVFPDF